jgi:hypothetical protein
MECNKYDDDDGLSCIPSGYDLRYTCLADRPFQIFGRYCLIP